MEKILIIDDDIDIADLESYLLKKEGFDTLICNTGEDALEEINKDFIMLNQISEEELFYNEIQHIINLSNKIKKKSCISNKELTKIGKKSKRMNTKA